MLSVCKIHEAGVVHGDLLDGHHFVKMEDSVRVIDFPPRCATSAAAQSLGCWEAKERILMDSARSWSRWRKHMDSGTMLLMLGDTFSGFGHE
jgi:isopenicillin N synthase-like dioxygenase